MTAATSSVTVTNSWSADLSVGSSNVLIQRQDDFPVLVYVGASAPANTENVGILLSGEDRVLSLANPAFTAVDKVFVKTTAFKDAVITVVAS